MIYSSLEEYFGTSLKYASDNGLTPLITIFADRKGNLAIMADNGKLTHDQKIQVLEMATNVARAGVAEERKGMIRLTPEIKK